MKFREFFKIGNNKKVLINILIFLVFAIISFISIYTHELWRDEAQSYMIARDLSIFGIIKQIRLDGHPALWYFLLKIFTTIGLPYEWMKIIPFILSSLAVGIFLKKSPFNIVINIMVIFGTTFMYFGTTFVRSYSLCLLLMILLIVIYKSRYKYSFVYGLLLFAIANTHVLLGGFVCALLLVDFYEFFKEKDKDLKRKILINFLIGFLSIILLVLQLYGGVGAREFGKSFNFSIGLLYRTLNMKIEIITFQINNENLLFFPLFGLFLLFIYGIYKQKYKIMLITGLGILFQVLVFVFVYPPNFYMGILFFLIILFGVYQIYDEKSKLILFIISSFIFLPSVYGAYYYVLNDIKYNFSDSKNIAKYIEKNIEKGSELYCLSTPYCSSINAYLSKNNYKFINLNTLEKFTYENWHVKFLLSTNDEIMEKIMQKKVRYYIKLNIYDDLFINEKIKNGEAKIIYSSKSKYISRTNETFEIIEFAY